MRIVNSSVWVAGSQLSYQAEWISTEPSGSRWRPLGRSTPIVSRISSTSGSATSKMNSPPSARCSRTRRRHAARSAGSVSTWRVFMATMISRNAGSSVKDCSSPTTVWTRASTAGASPASSTRICASISGERLTAHTSSPSRARGIATRPAAAPRSSTGEPSRAPAERQ